MFKRRKIRKQEQKQLELEIKERYERLKEIILSCETELQILTANEMVEDFCSDYEYYQVHHKYNVLKGIIIGFCYNRIKNEK